MSTNNPKQLKGNSEETADIDKDILCGFADAEANSNLVNQVRVVIGDLLNKVGDNAHDLNNLVIQFLALIDLNRDKLSEYDQQMLTETVNRITSTIGDLYKISNFSALPDSENGLVFMETDLQKFFDEIIALFRRTNPNIELDSYITLGQMAFFNQSKIKSVIENILKNATEAMPKTGGLIKITVNDVFVDEDSRLVESVSGGFYTSISIEDNGHGIPNEIEEKVFNRFFTSKPKGHGIGLASIKQTIKNHGGCILLESETGDNSFTKFTLLLPKYESSHEASQRSAEITDCPKRHSSMPVEPVIYISDQAESSKNCKKLIISEGGKCHVHTPSDSIGIIRNVAENSVVVIDNDPVLADYIRSVRPDIIIIFTSEEKPKDKGNFDSWLPSHYEDVQLIDVLSEYGSGN